MRDKNDSPIIHRRKGLLHPSPGVQGLGFQSWIVLDVSEHRHVGGGCLDLTSRTVLLGRHGATVWCGHHKSLTDVCWFFKLLSGSSAGWYTIFSVCWILSVWKEERKLERFLHTAEMFVKGLSRTCVSRLDNWECEGPRGRWPCVLCCTSDGHRGNELVSCSVGQTLPCHCDTHQLCIHPLTPPASLLVKLPRGHGRSPVATTGHCPPSGPITARRELETANQSKESRSSSAPVGSHQKFWINRLG